MDSNSICFGMGLSSSFSIKSLLMLDESESYKSKSTDESTNFVDFQQFKKASIGSCQTLDCDQESVSQGPQQTKKTKIIHKQKNPKKQQQKHGESQYSHKLRMIASKTAANEKPQVEKSKINQNPATKPVEKKPTNTRGHCFANIFDWMMQIAGIMKLSRSVFYRACNIFYESYKREAKVLENSCVQKYVCAALNISAKLETSNMDFLEELFEINKKRIAKQAISDAEAGIYKILQWKVPLLSVISQQVRQVFEKWNQYLENFEKNGQIRTDTKDRLSLNSSQSQHHGLKSKLQGQILYLLDMMLLNQAKKYLTANSLQPDNISFYTPIVIAMYSVFTIHHGDPQNKEKFLLPLVKSFYREKLQMTPIQVDRLPKEIQVCFMLFGFDYHLTKIPLGKDFTSVVQKDSLFYLPINVLKKTDK